jgi:hypothetical protein
MGPQYDNGDHDDMKDSSMYNIFGNVVRPKLFPLSQYRFIDPCKKCLVRSSCKPHHIDCPEHDKYFLWKSYLSFKRYRIKELFKHPIRKSTLHFWNILLICLVVVGLLFVIAGITYITLLSWWVAYQAWFL